MLSQMFFFRFYRIDSNKTHSLRFFKPPVFFLKKIDRFFYQGLVLLAVQAHLPQLRSAPCNMLTMEGSCERAGGTRAAVFFVALYLVALGAGCVMPNMTAYGGDQFAAGEKGAKRLSTYFNLSYLGYCVAEVAALTAVVWAQTRFGMAVGFGLAAAALGAGLLALASGAAVYRNKPPRGSVIFTPIARVRN